MSLVGTDKRLRADRPQPTRPPISFCQSGRRPPTELAITSVRNPARIPYLGTATARLVYGHFLPLTSRRHFVLAASPTFCSQTPRLRIKLKEAAHVERSASRTARPQNLFVAMEGPQNMPSPAWRQRPYSAWPGARPTTSSQCCTSRSSPSRRTSASGPSTFREPPRRHGTVSRPSFLTGHAPATVSSMPRQPPPPLDDGRVE